MDLAQIEAALLVANVKREFSPTCTCSVTDPLLESVLEGNCLKTICQNCGKITFYDLSTIIKFAERYIVEDKKEEK